VKLFQTFLAQSTKSALDCGQKAKKVNFKCVFWNFTLNQWDTNGCNYTSVNKDVHECNCNHMTSFAVLMVSKCLFLSEFEDFFSFQIVFKKSLDQTPLKCEVCALILEYATYIGVGLSILGLTLTILIYSWDVYKFEIIFPKIQFLFV
jgi:hypothetical protein